MEEANVVLSNNGDYVDESGTIEMEEMVNFNMPDDIIRNILARLPTKPLLQSRCVSTHWNRLITDPYFIKSKLRRKILLVSPDFHAIEDNGPLGDDVVELRHPNFECHVAYYTYRDISILGTFDGIVVFVVNHYNVVDKLLSFTSHILFYNPFTGSSEMLPDPYSPFYDNEHIYGFGYGATKDELKIVRFRDFTETPLYNWNTCDVFNLKERSWSSSSEIVIKRAYFLDHVGAFVNGFLYWFAVSKIVALDVKEMVISEIRLPVTCINTKTHLGTLHGRLSMITYTKNPFEFNMWIMKMTEQGVKNSWSETRLLTLDLEVRSYTGLEVISLMDC
ncbi:F-box domain containing protein [Tanacetum coccineum]|uniref:F-box domain containing protein n=1 Tax=Tanacetum coccineum TaxID=301880 RepID=A0ABQ4ZK57_9ASTR